MINIVCWQKFYDITNTNEGKFRGTKFHWTNTSTEISDFLTCHAVLVGLQDFQWQ